MLARGPRLPPPRCPRRSDRVALVSTASRTPSGFYENRPRATDLGSLRGGIVTLFTGEQGVPVGMCFAKFLASDRGSWRPTLSITIHGSRTNEESPAGLYADRTDDRGRDHRHSGRRRTSG